MALGIFSEDNICTSLCGLARGTFTLRELECFKLVLVVVNNAFLWKDAGLVTCFVGLCAMGDGRWEKSGSFVLNCQT